MHTRITTDRHAPANPPTRDPKRAALDWVSGNYATRSVLSPEMPEPRRAARPTWLAINGDAGATLIRGRTYSYDPTGAES